MDNSMSIMRVFFNRILFGYNDNDYYREIIVTPKHISDKAWRYDDYEIEQ